MTHKTFALMLPAQADENDLNKAIAKLASDKGWADYTDIEVRTRPTFHAKRVTFAVTFYK